MRKIFISIAIIIILLIVNACYWLCSDIQTKCVNKIADNQELFLYEKGSILTLHLGICTVGSFYCSEAAYVNFQMQLPSKILFICTLINGLLLKLKRGLRIIN